MIDHALLTILDDKMIHGILYAHNSVVFKRAYDIAFKIDDSPFAVFLRYNLNVCGKKAPVIGKAEVFIDGWCKLASNKIQQSNLPILFISHG